ncbi:hypothetical protein LCGC14_0337470 [marine sediment metagenome]|uniref:Uncharacterized protein n=1 Tax=marine sediment metagenome TaxID=412755 RepID=A0A0F9TET5_9ZZZZ
MKEFSNKKITEHIDLCIQMGHDSTSTLLLIQVWTERNELLKALKTSIHPLMTILVNATPVKQGNQ